MKLKSLIEQAVNETVSKPKKKLIGEVIGVLIGAFSSVVFIGPNQRLVAGDRKFFQDLLVYSSVGINTFVNGYFNVIAAREFFDLWDPVTNKLQIPLSHLLGLIFFSASSAFCFAFIDYKMFLIFGLEIFSYATQHFFAIKDGYDALPEAAPKDENEEKFRADKEILIQKVNDAQIACYQGFESKYPASRYFEEEHIKQSALKSWINSSVIKTRIGAKNPLNASQKSLCSPVQISKWVQNNKLLCFTQIMGWSLTNIANVCFHNQAINGFLSIKFLNLSKDAAWGIATICVAPVYGLAWIVTWRTINQVFETFQEGLSGDHIPYFIRKNVKTSILVGIPLTVMAIFSYGSSMQLTEEGIYPVNPQNPANFSFLDNDQQHLHDFYIYTTAIINIIFNFFPVVPIVETVVKNIRYYFFGSKEEKQQIQVMNFFNTLRNRIVKTTYTPPAEAKVPALDPMPETTINLLQQPLINESASSKKNWSQCFWSLLGKSHQSDEFFDNEVIASVESLNR